MTGGPTPTLSVLGQAALDYTTRFGWAVFPLVPNGKTPLTAHGFKDASTDPDCIRGWWTTTPNANIGIATGTHSNLVVLDLDSREAVAAFVEAYGDPLTPCSTTGRGAHLMFAHPGGMVRSRAGALGPEMDVRGDGGYIVAPPSIHPSGRAYEWHPERHPLLMAPMSLPPALLGALSSGMSSATGEAPDQESLRAPSGDHVRQVVAAIPNDTDRDGFVKMAHAIRGAVGEDADGAGAESFAGWCDRWAEDSGVDTNVNDPEEVAEVWRKTRGQTVRVGWGWLLDRARKFAPELVAETVAERFEIEPAPPGAPVPTIPSTPITPAGTRRRFRVLTIEELMQEPDLEWQVPDLVPRRGMGLVFGESGTGKTFLVLDLALSIASGLPFLGRDVKQGRVVYVAGEGRLKARVAAWQAAHPGANTDSLRVVPAAPDLADPREAETLREDIEAAAGNQVDLIVLDTWTRVTPGKDENSNSDTSLAIDICGRMAERFGAGFLVIHHTGVGDANRPRGATALFAAADYAWLVKNKHNPRSLTCSKMRDAEPFPTTAFHLRARAPSCVIEGGETVAAPALTPAQESVLAVLRSAAGPMRAKEWQGASHLAERTFHRARKFLLDVGAVTKQGEEYAAVATAAAPHRTRRAFTAEERDAHLEELLGAEVAAS